MKTKMSDRERILMHAIDLLGMDALSYSRSDRFVGGQPEPGDLVLCATTHGHPVKVSWFLEKRGYSDALLREVGSPKLWLWGNERFEKIDFKRTIFADQYAEGKEYDLVRKIHRAIEGMAEFPHRISSIDFEGLPTWDSRRPCSVTFRAHIFHGSKQTYAIPIKWNTRTSVKAIVEQLKAGGYGDDSKFGPNDVVKTCEKPFGPAGDGAPDTIPLENSP